MSAPTVLVTGGAGYIGSHVCKALAQAGYLPVSYDNLIHGHRDAVRWGPLELGDIGDSPRVEEVLRCHHVRAVLHFAGYAYVGESVEDPARYYRNNVAGTLGLLEAMLRCDVPAIVFSSTCATYGTPEAQPISEATPQRPINPYGAGKLMVERMLADFAPAYGMRSAILRYFNACGADPGGEIGEDHDPETHLIPRALMAAAGSIPALDIFGTDYPTPDGTCIRDYIHVSDLAAGHVLALRYLLEGGASIAVNLGTGRGVSVREIIACVARVTGRTVPLREGPRRAGDPPILLADAREAARILGFSARHQAIDDAVASAWKWLCHGAARRGMDTPAPNTGRSPP